MSRLFDPVSLLQANVEANATRRDPLPAGETIAQIIDLSFSEGISNKPGKPASAWNRLDCKLEITDPEYCSQYVGNPEKIVTTLGVMIDCTDLLSKGGSLKTGPNVNIRLGKLREAAGVNGKPLGALNGQHIRVQIGHKPHPTDPETVLDEIVAYTKV